MVLLSHCRPPSRGVRGSTGALGAGQYAPFGRFADPPLFYAVTLAGGLLKRARPLAGSRGGAPCRGCPFRGNRGAKPPGGSA